MTMVVTHNELVQLRIKLLKEMNTYIIEMGDEEIWMDWITLGVPDAPSEDDYEFIAENDDEWNDVCGLFGKLAKEEAD